jgi:L-alanine-DL-glutamate epimerase-like enolase superfamily enzyme
MLTAQLHHLEIPFARSFGHALATRASAEAIVLTVALAGAGAGAAGVGECVPRAYVTGETFDSVWAAIRGLALDEVWRRVDRSSPAALAASVEALRLSERLRDDALGPAAGCAAGCAVELALLDLACRLEGWRLSELAFAMGLPAGLLSAAPLPEVISAPLDFTREPRELIALLGSRLGHLKVKVGASLDEDVRRLDECRRIFGPALSMSVDANMAWSFEAAARAADAFRPFQLAWYEEPLRPAERHRYRELRERAGVAVMLDEAVCSHGQAVAAISSGSCDLINIRISKCGGYLAALRLAELAVGAGVRFQHGAQVGQLGILNAAGRHFTSVVRGVVACEGGPGLTNLRDFPTSRRVQLDWEAGHLVGLEGPGLGVTADAEKLRRYAARTASWDGARWS